MGNCGSGGGGGGSVEYVPPPPAPPPAPVTPPPPVVEEVEMAEEFQQTFATGVRMFSGCLDHQTSSDTSNTQHFGLSTRWGPSGAGGAATNAFIKAMETLKNPSWIEVLQDMRKTLKGHDYSQIPELSANSDLDLGEGFSLENPLGGGKKKALLIGINYIGMDGELRGCINDVEKMQKLLKVFGFNEFKILTDNTSEKPTVNGIARALMWLVEDASAGDSLFFHYSGHGGKLKDRSGDEGDKQDETLVPLNYAKKGQILDDDLFQLLVSPLPKDVQLTALMDCCHSGSILDLPWSLTMDRSISDDSKPRMHLDKNFLLHKGSFEKKKSTKLSLEEAVNETIAHASTDAVILTYEKPPIVIPMVALASVLVLILALVLYFTLM